MKPSVDSLSVYKALALYTFRNLKTESRCSEITTMTQWIERYLYVFEKRKLANGEKWTLDRYKSIYMLLRNHLYKVDNQSTIHFIKTIKNGLPKEVSAISHLIYDGSPWLRVIMSVLRIFESITVKAEFDESPITTPSRGKPHEEIEPDFKLFLTKWLKKHRKSLVTGHIHPHQFTIDELSYRFKSGPMGPSILTAHLDALALCNRSEFLETFLSYCYATGNIGITRLMEIAKDNCIVMKPLDLPVGKISLVAEPAGKTRPFAICNFWVQSVLKPFHDRLMLILKKFKSDGTFDQIGQFNRILALTKNKKTFCFDLSKATDRFPIEIQRVIFEVLLGEEFAKAWTNLMINLPYRYKSKDYFWAVGQPLGAFSSWASFSLAHHLVVQYCYYKTHRRIKWFSQYGMIGDDIVIWNRKVAVQYQSFMNDLGVDINLSKSLVGVNSGEFAKRHFLSGQNISGFGFPLIQSAIASADGWIRFLEILESEGFTPTGGSYFEPRTSDKGLPKSLAQQLQWKWTIRQAFAQNTLLFFDNKILTESKLVEHYILRRIDLLYSNTTTCLKPRQMAAVIKQLVKFSDKWGVTVRTDCLDVRFSPEGEFLSHPLIRYLNFRDNSIWDKIDLFSNIIKDSLWTHEGIMSLRSYTQEEYIPDFKLDTFFSRDVNEVKHRVKISVQTKALDDLIKAERSIAADGETNPD